MSEGGYMGPSAQTSHDLNPSLVVTASEAPRVSARVMRSRAGAPQSSVLPIEGRCDGHSESGDHIFFFCDHLQRLPSPMFLFFIT